MDIRMTKDEVSLYKNNEEILKIDINGKINRVATFVTPSVEEMESVIKIWKEWKNPKIPSDWTLRSTYTMYNSLEITINKKTVTNFLDNKSIEDLIAEIPLIINYLKNFPE